MHTFNIRKIQCNGTDKEKLTYFCSLRNWIINNYCLSLLPIIFKSILKLIKYATKLAWRQKYLIFAVPIQPNPSCVAWFISGIFNTHKKFDLILMQILTFNSDMLTCKHYSYTSRNHYGKRQRMCQEVCSMFILQIINYCNVISNNSILSCLKGFNLLRYHYVFSITWPLYKSNIFVRSGRNGKGWLYRLYKGTFKGLCGSFPFSPWIKILIILWKPIAYDLTEWTIK